jgi:predicted esterase
VHVGLKIVEHGKQTIQEHVIEKGQQK